MNWLEIGWRRGANFSQRRFLCVVSFVFIIFSLCFSGQSKAQAQEYGLEQLRTMRRVENKRMIEEAIRRDRLTPEQRAVEDKKNAAARQAKLDARDKLDELEAIACLPGKWTKWTVGAKRDREFQETKPWIPPPKGYEKNLFNDRKVVPPTPAPNPLRGGHLIEARPVKMSPLYVWLQPKEGGEVKKVMRFNLPEEQSHFLVVMEKQIEVLKRAKAAAEWAKKKPNKNADSTEKSQASPTGDK